MILSSGLHVRTVASPTIHKIGNHNHFQNVSMYEILIKLDYMTRL